MTTPVRRAGQDFERSDDGSSLEGFVSTVQELFDSPAESRESKEREKKSQDGNWLSFVSDGVKRLTDAFKESSPFTKAILIAGGAALTYKASKLVGKALDFFKTSMDSLFGLGDRFRDGIEGIQSKTIERILLTALGGTLGTGTIGLLYESIKGKLGFPEVSAELKNGPSSFALFLVRKAKEGVISIPDDILTELSETFGLPDVSGALDELEEAVETGQEIASQVKEKLFEHRDELFHYLDVNFPNWKSNPAMAPFLDLSLDDSFLKHLKFDSLDEEDLTEKWLPSLMDGGGMFLIMSTLVGPGWISGFAGVNLALFSVLKKYGVMHRFESMLPGLDTFEMDMSTKISDALDLMGVNPEDAGLRSSMVTVDEALEYVTRFAKAHPGISGLTITSAASLSTALTVYMMWHYKDFLARMGGNVITFPIEHPRAFAALAVFGGLGALHRNQLAETFIPAIGSKFHDKGSPEYEEFFQKTSGFFDFEENKGEWKDLEHVTSPLYERFMEDPAEFFLDPENRRAFFDEGGSFRISAAGDIIGGFATGTHPLFTVIKLGQYTKDEFLDLMFSDSENKLGVGLLMAGEGLVIYKMGKGYLKGYGGLVHVSNVDSYMGKGVRVLASLIPGATKSNRYLWKSMLREAGDTIPFMKLTDMIHADVISKVARNGREILELAEGLNQSPPPLALRMKARSSGKTVAVYVQEQIAHHYGHLEAAVKKLSEAGSDFKQFNDIKVVTKLNLIKDTASSVKFEALKGAVSDTNLASLVGRIDDVETGYSRLLSLEFMHGKGKDYKKVSTFSVEDVVGRSEMELAEELAGLRRRLPNLSKGSEEWMRVFKQVRAIEVALNPDLIKSSEILKAIDFEGVDSATRARLIEQMAGELQVVEEMLAARVEGELQAIHELIEEGTLSKNSPEVKEMLEEIDKDLIKPFADRKVDFLNELGAEYKKLDDSLKTPRLKAQVQMAYGNSFLTRVTKGVKDGVKFRGGVAVVMATAMFASEYVQHGGLDAEVELHQVLEEIGPEVTQLLMELIPFYGSGLSIHTAVTGTQKYNPEAEVLEGWHRHQHWAWGVAGFAGDIASVLLAVPSGGSSVAGVMAARLTALVAKGGSKGAAAAKLLKLLPKLDDTSKAMGGWKNVGRSLYNFVQGNKAVAVRRLNRTAFAGAGVGLAGVGVHLVYEHRENAVDIPEDLMAGIDTVIDSPSTSNSPTS